MPTTAYLPQAYLLTLTWYIFSYLNSSAYSSITLFYFFVPTMFGLSRVVSMRRIKTLLLHTKTIKLVVFLMFDKKSVLALHIFLRQIHLQQIK